MCYCQAKKEHKGWYLFEFVLEEKLLKYLSTSFSSEELGGNAHA